MFNKFLTNPLAALIGIFLIVSCSQQSNVEGDIFLIKGDGTPQPAAGREIIFFSNDTNIEDASDALITILTNVYNNQFKKNSPKKEEFSEFCNLFELELDEKLSFINNNLDKERSNNNHIKSSSDSCNNKFSSASFIENQIKLNLGSIAKLQKEDDLALINEKNELLKNVIDKLNLSYDGRYFKLTNNSKYIIYLDSGDEPEYQYISELGTKWGTNIIGSSRELDTYELRKNYTKKDKYDIPYHKYDVFIEPGEALLLDDFLDYPFVSSGNIQALQEAFTKLSSSGKCKGGYDSNTNIVTLNGTQQGIGEDVRGCFTINTTKISFKRPNQFKLVNFPKQIADGSYIFEEIDLTNEAKKNIGSLNASRILELIQENSKLRSDLSEFQNNKAECKKEEQVIASLNARVSEIEKGRNLIKECKFFNLYQNYNFLVGKLGEPSSESFNFLNRVKTSNIGLDANITFLEDLVQAPVTTTTIQGHYEIDELSKGNYLLISEYIDNFTQGTYLKAVNLSNKDESFDLSNRDFINAPLTYVLKKFFELCDENGSCPNDISVLEGEYKAYVKAQDDLLQALEELKNYKD